MESRSGEHGVPGAGAGSVTVIDDLGPMPTDEQRELLTRYGERFCESDVRQRVIFRGTRWSSDDWLARLIRPELS